MKVSEMMDFLSGMHPDAEVGILNDIDVCEIILAAAQYSTFHKITGEKINAVLFEKGKVIGEL